MRIHTLQGLYLYVENLLQAIISLVKTRSYPNTTCPSYVFLFSQAICHQAEFPAAWHRTAVFSCPALLPAGKGDKYGTGEKRMPWGTLHQQRQTVFRHCFSEHIGQIWNPQPIFQGLHRTERNITYQTIGRAEKSMLRFEGFIDCLSFLTLRLENCPQSPDFNRQNYMVLNSVGNVSKALYAMSASTASLTMTVQEWKPCSKSKRNITIPDIYVTFHTYTADARIWTNTCKNRQRQRNRLNPSKWRHRPINREAFGYSPL